MIILMATKQVLRKLKNYCRVYSGSIYSTCSGRRYSSDEIETKWIDNEEDVTIVVWMTMYTTHGINLNSCTHVVGKSAYCVYKSWSVALTCISSHLFLCV